MLTVGSLARHIARNTTLENIEFEKITDLKDMINKSALKYIIEDTTHLERVFQWKAIVKAVNESLGK